MTEEKAVVKMPHQIILENRKSLSVSGVREVVSFDETQVEMSTSMGDLTIRGENLHISKTDVETGELLLDGEVSEICYSALKSSSGGLWSRVFH
jgi:sporulation protein YabP